MAEILAAPDQAVLMERHYDSYSRFIKPMNFMSTNFFAHEDIYRAYYGKKNVQFVNDSVYVRYQEGRLLDGAKTYVPKSNRPDLVGNVYTFDNQDYIAVLFKAEAMPGSFQTAECHGAEILGARERPNEAEQERRRNYGINIDYDPAGFYPLEYQGRCYLICEQPKDDVARIVFTLWLSPGGETIPVEISL